MKIRLLPDLINYNGSQINPLWAYNYCSLKGNSIVIFRGAMNIRDEYVKDIEDKKDKKEIKGDDLIHFIIERFDSPTNIRLVYYMQRLLIICIKEILEKKNIKTLREGDDLYIPVLNNNGIIKKKLTVSIATIGISCEKIHCGINLTSKGTPTDVEVIGLFELGLNINWKEISMDIAKMFVKEVNDIEKDIFKTKCL